MAHHNWGAIYDVHSGAEIDAEVIGDPGIRQELAHHSSRFRWRRYAMVRPYDDAGN